MTPNYLVDHEGQPETMNLVNNSLVNTDCDEINEEVWTRQGAGAWGQVCKRDWGNHTGRGEGLVGDDRCGCLADDGAEPFWLFVLSEM